MQRFLWGASLLAIGATIAFAQAGGEAAVKARQDLMKQQSGALKDPGAMNKGEAPFDLTKVQASLKKIQETAAAAKAMWPDDSKGGNSLPSVWEKKQDFLARFDKLGADAKAAAAAIKDEATFKAEFKKVTDNCGGCHKEYRKPPEKK